MEQLAPEQGLQSAESGRHGRRRTVLLFRDQLDTHRRPAALSPRRPELMQPDPQFRTETARGAEMCTAERVCKVQRVVSICEIQDANSH
jgi:hypothetical protein